jgi:2-polyprenyl-6-methoxyphenol hydroxylase-like FAD-dependent oxidoreductase
LLISPLLRLFRLTIVGFGGLTAAIECHRQGHDVEVYESFPELKVLGDIISFGSNAGRIFRRWGVEGSISNKLRSLSIDLRKHGFRIHKYTGEHIITQPTPEQDPEAPVFNGHRGELHQVIFNYARDDLKIPIHLGHRVERYFEEADQAGIELDDGQKVCIEAVRGMMS